MNKIWICSPDFFNLSPINVLHKENRKTKGEEHIPSLFHYHAVFRNTFFLDKLEKIAINITADDYFFLYINGEYVAAGPANSYFFCYYYNQIDITPFIREGENTVAVHVYYHGLITRAYVSGDYRQGLAAEILSGDKNILDNTKWKCRRMREYTPGHIIGYNTQFAENIDNRLKIKDIYSSGTDDSEWESACIKADDDHVLIKQETRSITGKKKFPKETIKTERGVFIDFGCEFSGTVHLAAKGRSGDKIILKCAEELYENGEMRFDMRCNCRYIEELILDDGENIFENFEYKCFRYAFLECYGAEITEIYAYERHYPIDEDEFRYSFSDDLLNRIFDICKRAVINCTQESFLDCPHREKGAYLGDMMVTAHSYMILSGDTALYKKSLECFASTSRICKGLMAVSSSSLMQEIADFSLLFPSQLLLYYDFSGDREFLFQMLSVLDGLDEYFGRYCNSDGLIEGVDEKWNLVDWPENLRDDYDFPLTRPIGKGCHNVINALYCGMIKSIEEIKRLLQVPYTERYCGLKENFIKHFYNRKTKLFCDSTVSSHSAIQSNIYPIYFGLLPEEKTSIPEFIRNKGLCCGVYSAYFLLNGLCNIGEYSLAYELITNKTEHSWYQMLKEGATSAFETWGKEQKWNTSLCHAWASAPIPVIIRMISRGGEGLPATLGYQISYRVKNEKREYRKESC